MLLDEICRDLRNMAENPHLTMEYHPLLYIPGSRYRPPGVFVTAVPGPGRPVIYRWPPPLHPLEVLYALRGGVGIENENSGEALLAATVALRSGKWLDVTERIAERLFYTPSQVRLIYHLLTPWNTAGPPMFQERARLYAACGLRDGLSTEAFAESQGDPRDPPPRRDSFFTETTL